MAGEVVRIWNRSGSSWNRGGPILLLVAIWNGGPASAEDALGGAATIEARATIQGEQTGRLIAQALLGAVTLHGGGESATGQHAPLRHAAIAGAGVEVDGWEAEGEARLAPPQAGADGLSAELTARRSFNECVSASLGVALHHSSWSQCTACGVQELRALGATAETEVALPQAFKAGLRASAFNLELREPTRAPATSRSRKTAREFHPGPWDRFGASTLDWPERWDATALAQGKFGPIGAALSAGLGAPPADGALNAHAQLKLDGAVGLFTGALAAAVARISPSGQVLAEVSLSVGVHFGGIP